MTATDAPPQAAAGAPKKQPSTAKSDPQKHGRLALLLLTPTFLVLALVIGYPLIAAIRESLYQKAEGVDESGFVLEGERFVGIDNYSAIFTGESAERFWNAFFNTTFFTVTTLILEIVIGVTMALVMHHALRGKGLVRASILVPWAIPTAVSAIMWQFIFTADGVANEVLNSQILWTTEGFQAKIAVIIADVWKTAPFVGLLVLAGLQIIPNDVYEAARVDGASAWKQFWRITLPLVKPALLVAILFRGLDALRMFDLPFVMIGQRKQSVETLSMLAQEEASQLRIGPAAAYAVVLFVYVSLIAYAFVKLLGADVIGEARARAKETKQRKAKAVTA
ncbi:carbohydrate ABC transporter permease [Actinophytocola algeriensis]|uniref:Multiple sugar transport system permease protein n=1 Tax=Actinophytocola algeriensis TaxID=1768010 RepID=A0A7W7Q090_9PSEU|nr:sugar ABC transporter permease [Actinophytocola algeriensis]MBB4904458.1 multiple sugar transport system permease protein [Actinophytocola algeriensis]MBE1476683.1 multiple sugar transport system permease protein [Actinophytocola algeriensis]